MSGIFISQEDLMLLSPSARDEIIKLISGITQNDHHYEEDEIPVDLSTLQAERLVQGVSEKTKLVLKTIVEQRSNEQGFWCKELAEELGLELSDLSGVWSGLTRRTRTVTNDPYSFLISWMPWDEKRDDYYGQLHHITIANCRKALNI